MWRVILGMGMPEGLHPHSPPHLPWGQKKAAASVGRGGLAGEGAYSDLVVLRNQGRQHGLVRTRVQPPPTGRAVVLGRCIFDQLRPSGPA